MDLVALQEHVKKILDKPKPKSTFNFIQNLHQQQIGTKKQMAFQKSCTDFLISRPAGLHVDSVLGNDERVTAKSFDNTGEILGSAIPDGTIKLWHCSLGKMIYSYKPLGKAEIDRLKFLNLKGGYHIVTCCGGDVRYQHIGNECVRLDMLIKTHRRDANCVTVDQKQPQVFLTCGRKNVFRHDLRMCPDDHQKILKNKTGCYQLDSNPINFNEFLTFGDDHIIKVFDQRMSKPKYLYAPPSNKLPKLSQPCSAYFNHNGSEILATYREGIRLFNRNDDKDVRCFEGNQSLAIQIRAKFLGPDSKYIVSGSECGHLFIWDKKTEAIIQCSLGDLDGPVINIVSHPHGPYLCSTGLDKGIKLWAPGQCKSKTNIDDIVYENMADIYDD